MTSIVFIVGTGRCGTQMLRNVLNNWNSVVILPETHFLISLYDKYGLEEISADKFIDVVDNTYGSSGNKWVEVMLAASEKEYVGYKEGFSNYVINNRIRGNIRNFAEAFYEFLYGKCFMFGDKTPHYGTNLSIIRDLWPDMKVIHLVRDGVDCAHSMLKHSGFRKLINGRVFPQDYDRVMYKGKQLAFSSDKPSMKAALDFWRDTIEAIDSEFKQIDVENKIVVNYENIVFNPKDEVTRIAKFLGIDFDGGALRKAIDVPRPFPEKHQVNRMQGDEYIKYYQMIEKAMVRFGYPYKIEVNRGFIGCCKELYRGRYNYLYGLKKKAIRKIRGIR